MCNYCIRYGYKENNCFKKEVNVNKRLHGWVCPMKNQLQPTPDINNLNIGKKMEEYGLMVI